ncbi:hypothetical protein TNCV_4617741 [Trichonephila clavipes]|nr:hypothetical protein TNCV_4617741 [Trichonephila clavipes]
MEFHLLGIVYGDTKDALNIYDIVPERSTFRNIHEDPVCVPFHVSVSSVASLLGLILQQDHFIVPKLCPNSSMNPFIDMTLIVT